METLWVLFHWFYLVGNVRLMRQTDVIRSGKFYVDDDDDDEDLLALYSVGPSSSAFNLSFLLL